MKDNWPSPDMPPSVLAFIQCLGIVCMTIVGCAFYGEFRKLKTEVYWYKHEVDNVSDKNYGCIEAWDALKKRVEDLEAKAVSGE